jgi:hypothetical protein
MQLLPNRFTGLILNPSYSRVSHSRKKIIKIEKQEASSEKPGITIQYKYNNIIIK